MNINTDLLIDLSENMALLFPIVFGYSLILPLIQQLPDMFKSIIIGILFATVAMIGMFYPIEIAPGILIDSCVVLVALAGVFGGFRAGTTAGVLIGIYRASLGGIGVIAGIGAILGGATLGILVKHHFQSDLSYVRYWHFLLLGLALAIQGLLWTFVLLVSVARSAFTQFAVPVLLYYPLATLFLGSLFTHELPRRTAEYALIDNVIYCAL